MAADALAEIDGYKPKVLLADGEDCEAKSKNGGMTYKIKRTRDHYFCHCPAWRNQKGVPVNARTCTHLGDILGYGYELARLKLKTGKANGSSKSRKRDDSDDDEGDDEDEGEDEDEDEDEDESPKKKARKSISKAEGKRQADSDEEDEDEEEEEDERPKKKARKPISKAKGKKKADSEEDDSDSDSPPKKKARKPASKAKGKKKEDSEDEDDDSDARPKKKVRKPVSKAKGRKKVDSEEDEDQDSDESPKKKRKPASKAKGKKKVDSDGDADDSDEPPKKKAKKAVSTPKRKKRADSEEEEEEDDEPPKKKARKPASKPKGKKKADSDEEEEEDVRPAKKKPVSKAKGKTKVESDDEGPSKGKGKKKADSDEEDGDEDDDEDEKPTKQSKSTSTTGDDLAEIDGHKPKVLLDDGEDREVKSLTSSSTYKIKRTWDHYYCQCPAWRNQAGVPVNARTCKHLRDLLGEEYEAARVKWKNPDGAPLRPVSKKGKRKRADDDNKPKSKSKRAKVDDDEDDDDDDSGGKQVPAMLLANKWDIDNGPDPTGWWISEKLDGVRTFYDGKGMVSRLGNPFTPPKWFLDKLPKDCTLDGELFGGRGNFQDTVSIVKTMNSPHWKGITFQIFDVPSETTAFEDRVAFLKKLFGPGGKYECPEVVLVEHEKAKNRKHVLEKLKEIEELGGEGLMLRKAGSKYEARRSSTLLKIKTFYDAEAEVTGYTDGKGKNAGTTGALKCKMQSGKTFNVGTGLSDKLRRNPPKIGSIIVYRFQELTRDGVPRFPSYIGESADKTKAKDAKLPAHRKTGAKKDE
ncbi:DNA ligase [Mycena alexandri]|uniref:DNA ligase n=1 Tax=Mycena alexandri TaxID=1745969 RepID=A0AAD6TAE6_9AGAR|nr:DNA ligase [Mycena alexandri]